MDAQMPPNFSPLERLRERFGPRALGFLVALGLELLLLALLLSLGQATIAPGGDGESIATFDVSAPPQAQEQDSPAEAEEAPAQLAPPTRSEPPPAMPPPALILPRPNTVPAPPPTQAVVVPLSRDELASADIANIAPPRPQQRSGGAAYGPSFAAAAGDSEVVGRAPNGEPLYGARWYREPTDGELRGYLSTASGPGWALIACRTAPQWRVEDCVGLGEYPTGSNMERAVLAAAWQFQVRPPIRGGQSLVGSWVRIRIELERS